MSTFEQELNNMHEHISTMPAVMKELTGCLLHDSEETKVLNTRLTIVYLVLLQNQVTEQKEEIAKLKLDMQDLSKAHAVFAENSIL